MADIAVTAADVRPLPGAEIVRFEAGGTVNLGDAVYVDSSGKVQQADASVAGTAHALGIVVSCPDGKTSAASGQWVDVQVWGRIAGFSGMTPGDVLYTSDTTAKLADAAGTVSHKMGKPLTATVLYLRPGDEEA